MLILSEVHRVILEALCKTFSSLECIFGEFRSCPNYYSCALRYSLLYTRPLSHPPCRMMCLVNHCYNLCEALEDFWE